MINKIVIFVAVDKLVNSRWLFFDFWHKVWVV